MKSLNKQLKNILYSLKLTEADYILIVLALKLILSHRRAS